MDSRSVLIAGEHRRGAGGGLVGAGGRQWNRRILLLAQRWPGIPVLVAKARLGDRGRHRDGDVFDAATTECDVVADGQRRARESLVHDNPAVRFTADTRVVMPHQHGAELP